MSLFWEYLALVCTRLWPMNENQTFLWIMACLSVCWRFIISLIQHFMGPACHGIYMMSQLTTLLYFEAFDGDSPKNCLWGRIMLMSALSELLNAFGILVDLRNCPVHSSCRIISRIKYWIHQSANICCNLFLQIVMGGG